MDKLNVTTNASGIYVSGGHATLHYSEYDNRIQTKAAPAITVSAGAKLTIDPGGVNQLHLSSQNASAIGGTGTVEIVRATGNLTLATLGSPLITAAQYSYKVSGTATTPPYTYEPSAGTLIGYHDGTILHDIGSMPANVPANTYTACAYVCGSATANVTSNGELQFTGLSAQTVTVKRNGTPLSLGDYTYDGGVLTVSAAASYGNIIVEETKSVTDIQIVTPPTKLVYDHGQALALAGLTAKLTYSDNSESDVIPYDQFSVYGISVSPQNGQILSTEANHEKYVTVAYGGISSANTTTNQLTVKPTVSLTGSFEAGYTLHVETSGQAGSAFNWEYQVQVEEDLWETITVNGEPVTGPDLILTSDLANKTIRVAVTFSDSIYTGTAESPPQVIRAPQLSVTVPLSMTVTVGGAGTCTVSSDSITNNSLVDVYVTSVAYVWASDGATPVNYAGGVFADYTKVTAALTLGGTPGTAYSFTGASPSVKTPTAVNGKVNKSGGTLALPWSFALGTGNYIKLAMAAAQEVQVATITYTIGFEPPS